MLGRSSMIVVVHALGGGRCWLRECAEKLGWHAFVHVVKGASLLGIHLLLPYADVSFCQRLLCFGVAGKIVPFAVTYHEL